MSGKQLVNVWCSKMYTINGSVHGDVFVDETICIRQVNRNECFQVQKCFQVQSCQIKCTMARSFSSSLSLIY